MSCYVELKNLCNKGTSSIMQKDLEGIEGEYPIFGASGYIKNIDYYHQEREYIAVVKDGAGVGRVYLLPENSSVIGTLQYIIPNEDVDIKYLYYALTYANLSKYYTGATIPHIYFKDYCREKICFPDLNQQRIVAQTLGYIDSILEKRKSQLVKLGELLQSQFIEMFGEMDLSRKKKEWTPISCIGTVIGGSTPRTNDDKCWGGDYRWITPAELKQDSGYIYDSVRKITQFGIDSCSLQKIPPNTVLLTSRAPIGKLAIAGNDFYCNQGFKNIICKEEIHPRYLYTLLLHNVNYLNSLGRGATFKEISKEIVENIKIPLPPIELQNKFADFVRQVDKSKYRVYNSRKIINNLIEGIIHLQ
ncbi:restriction endonuclease subunit S [Filifactor villosus]|uniref:Restriction endonuclease subunit S n=1 Tax=Filifactor villosus TaxID=29374 RepID=A0ABV9QIT4_9FIRM